MTNDNINLFKLIHLDIYPIDNEKTSIHIPTKDSDSIKIDLYLKINERICPHCGSISCTIHDTIIKRINQSVIPNREILLLFHQRKFKCKDCQSTFLQDNPMCKSEHSITSSGELSILEELRNPRVTFKDAARYFHVPETSVIRLFDERIDIKRHTFDTVICIDEIYQKKLTKHKYCCVLFDPFKVQIIDILDSRHKDILEGYLFQIPIKERLNVKYVNMDMYSTYIEVSKKYFPNSVACIDSFHVIKHLVKAINDIRIRVQKKFLNHKNDDRNGYYWLLKTFSYYFVMNFDNIKYTRRPRSHYSYLYTKDDVLSKLLSIDDELKTAYKLKEEYREFNLVASYEEAKEKLPDFIERFKSSDSKEFREFGRMLERWKENILNSFIYVDGKRMNNGTMESCNGRIRRIIDNGYGFSNFTRFRNKVMYSLNKDEPIKW